MSPHLTVKAIYEYTRVLTEDLGLQTSITNKWKAHTGIQTPNESCLHILSCFTKKKSLTQIMSFQKHLEKTHILPVDTDDVIYNC